MEAELRNLFYDSVTAYGIAEDLPVSMPNVDFDPLKTCNVYLKPYVFPVRPQVLTLCGGMARYLWILQISVYNRKGVGEIKGATQADKIAAAYPVSYEFTLADHTYTVITPPSPVPAIPVGGWYSIPVEFRVSIFI